MATQSMAKPTPERIFATLTAYQQTAALKAAIELDLFTKIADGADKTASLAQSIGAAERGVRILADYMTIYGFLAKTGDRYALTPDSAVFLNRKSPAYMGAMAGFLVADQPKRNFDCLTDAVRKGGTAGVVGDNTKPQDEMWVSFAKSMGALAAPSAAFMAQLAGMPDHKPCKVLDVAASHGAFGITFAKQNPNAQIVALDWPSVLEVTKENAKQVGVADRLTVLPGSVFDVDLGTGYDFVLLTNILHHFDPPTVEKMLRRIHAALKPGGRVLALEFVPNDDRVSPPMAAGFSLIMLAGTDSGDAYTFKEYETMFRNAGFAKSSLHPVPEMPQHVVMSEK